MLLIYNQLVLNFTTKFAGIIFVLACLFPFPFSPFLLISFVWGDIFPPRRPPHFVFLPNSAKKFWDWQKILLLSLFAISFVEVTYSPLDGGCGQIGPTFEMIIRPPPLFKEKVRSTWKVTKMQGRSKFLFFTWKEQKICEGTKEAQGMLWWVITKEGKGTLSQDAMQQVIISMWNIF